MKGLAESAEGSEERGMPQREGGTRWGRRRRWRGGGVGAIVVPASGVRGGGIQGSGDFALVLRGGSLEKLVFGFRWDQGGVEGYFRLACDSELVIVIEAVGAVVIVVERVQRRISGTMRRNGRRKT